MTRPGQLLERAVSGEDSFRPLLVPLATVASGELRALTPRELLTDPTQVANLVRELTISLGADVAVAEFGTLWDAEALGAALEWPPGLPPRPSGGFSALGVSDVSARGRGPVVMECVRRLSIMLGEDRPVAASVTGPATLARLSHGSLDEAGAVSALVGIARVLLDHGARVIFVVESEEPPTDPQNLAQAASPLWGTIRFYRALGVLHLAGAADGWRTFVERGGAYVPCFDAALSPGLLGDVEANGRPFGLALPGLRLNTTARDLARSRRCVMLTSDGELAGRTSTRELPQLMVALRQLGDEMEARS